MKRIFLRIIPRILVGVGVGVSLFLGYRAHQEAKRNERIHAEIRSLEEEASRIDQENRNLRDRIEYLQSDTFREQEAKRMLEYQKTGEKVVFIRERSSLFSGDEKKDTFSQPGFLPSSETTSISNYRKWWNFLFKGKARFEEKGQNTL